MKSASLVLCALAALTGCAHAAAGAGGAVAARTEPSMRGPAVEITYADRVPGRPPKVDVLVDLTLRNPDKDARWFLLPEMLSPEEKDPKDGVSGVETWEVRGEGRAVIGRFKGNAGFQAILVPAGGQVKLRRFAIPAWLPGAESKKPLAVEVVIARSVTVGGQPIASWFGDLAPASDAKVVADASTASRGGAKWTEDRGEVAVKLTGDERVTLEVALPAPPASTPSPE